MFGPMPTVVTGLQCGFLRPFIGNGPSIDLCDYIVRPEQILTRFAGHQRRRPRPVLPHRTVPGKRSHLNEQTVEGVTVGRSNVTAFRRQ